MSKLDIEYKTNMNDLNGNVNALNSIISDKSNTAIKSSPVDESEYARHRTNHLTQKIAELIDVCESEFRKDEVYEAKINELNQKIQILEKENSNNSDSNNWYIKKNFRKIGKKFK